MAKTAATKISKSSPAKPAAKAVLTRNGSDKNGSAAEKFVAAKTGRVVKSSPAEPLLGRERIQAAVRALVRRDAAAPAKRGKFSG